MDIKALLKGIKPDLVAVKEKWAGEIKAKTGKTKEEPFPISVRRTIPQPELASEWDIDELVVLLSIDGVSDDGEATLHVEIPMPIPKALRMRISETVEEEWRKQLAAAGPVATRKSWAMIPTLEWVESKFSSLLSLVPDLIEAYEGCDDAGASMRRYTIVAEKYDEDAAAAAAAAAGVAASHDGGEGNAEEEFDDGLDDEERARRAAVVEEKRARKAAEEEAKEREKYAEAERKRILALEKGITLEVKPQQLSKKELEERHKSKQGVKMAKTGPRHKKYDGEGSAVEAAAKAAKAKKK